MGNAGVQNQEEEAKEVTKMQMILYGIGGIFIGCVWPILLALQVQMNDKNVKAAEIPFMNIAKLIFKCGFGDLKKDESSAPIELTTQGKVYIYVHAVITYGTVLFSMYLIVMGLMMDEPKA